MVGAVRDSDVSISLVEMKRHLENRDSRLSVVESCLRKIDEREQIWSRITQDGLADLAVKVQTASHGGGPMQQKPYATKDEDDSVVAKHLSNAEKHVQTKQKKAQNYPELDARISKAEHQLLELQASNEAMQVKNLQEVQERHDILNERLNVVSELCSLLRLNQAELNAQFHTKNVPDFRKDPGLFANFSRPTQSSRTLAGGMSPSSNGSVPTLESPWHQLRLSRPERQTQFQCQQTLRPW